MAELSVRESIFVAETIKGVSAVQAAVTAGWSSKYARTTAYKILERPAVAAAIKEAQAKLKADSEMTAGRLLKMFLDAYDMAMAAKQSTGAVRAGEMIGKLTGLIQEKLKVEHEMPSIIDAIEEGLARAGLPPHVTHEPPLIDITPTPAPAVADPFSD